MTAPAWPGYQPPTITAYPDPVADPTETRTGQALDGQFFTDLTRAVAAAAPRLKRVGMVTPAEGQVAQVDASAGNVTMPALPALPAGAIVGYERTDTATANVVTITADGTTTHTLRFRGHQIVLISRGGGVWDRLANWLPYDPMKAVLDALYATKTELANATQAQSGGSGGSSGGAASAKTKAYDDFTTKAAGTLGGTVADSGQTWVVQAATSAGSAAPVILQNAIGPPSGHTPGGTGGGGTAAGYAYLPLGSTAGLVGGKVRFDASDVAGAAASLAALGAFSSAPFDAASTSSSMHLSVTPYGCQFAVFSGSYSDYTTLVPAGYSSDFPRFPNTLPCDGVTETKVEIVIDRPKATAYVTIGDFPTLIFRDPRIRTVTANFAFWEYFTNTGGTNLPRFTKVWADPASSVESTPQSTQLAIATAAPGVGAGGSGPAGRRPASRMRGGATWWDQGVATTISAATAAGATTFTTPVPIPVGSIVLIDTGIKQETRTVTARTGTGPYTCTVAAMLNAHASGAAVVAGPKPTWSDGASWRDSSGVVAGNRLGQEVATASEGAGSLYFLNPTGTVAPARAPVAAWRASTCYKVTATAAGLVQPYLAFVLAEPGTPFFAGLEQMLAGVNARSATLALRFYDASVTQLGSDIVSSAVTIPTGSTPPAGGLLTPVAVAPAGTTAVLPVLTISGCAVGDTFFLGDWCIAPGPVPTHQRS